MTAQRAFAAACLAIASVGCTTAVRPPPSVSAEILGELMRPREPEGLSGISPISGNRYFAVDDRGGLLHEVEVALEDDGSPKSFRVLRSVRLAGRVDLEGCAYDSHSGLAWVSDEHDNSIRAFDPATGEERGRVAIPEVFAKNMRPNRSFEALAVSSDGLRLYAANEDTLSCDGEVASKGKGGVIRIQEFVRDAVSEPWCEGRRMRYETDAIAGAPHNGFSISGVVALAVDADGSLLVLEREMSRKRIVPTCRARIYAVRFDSPGKRLLLDENTGFANYEGMCLGPLMADGRRVLVLVSDGGGEADENVMTVALDTKPPVSSRQ